MRDKKADEERRRVWSSAFGDKAVRGYEERLRRYLNDLVDYFSSQATAGKPVNITKWFELYSYHFMGDLTLKSRNDSSRSLLAHMVLPNFYLDSGVVAGLAAATPAEIPDIASVLVAPIKGQQPSREQWELL
ncbi:hypothetical protein AtubIFM54640_011544 [Aspergillus tubingensis]|nr:hypothetical protein AtubIFM54640_011544 [Aspergillus tubingensis]GLB16183.1 hypothetical protein AtubIFM61612_006022 [Aspergillus tubingensis]